MNNKYEKDGIIYFKTPFRVKYTDWIYSHLDCDSIITEKSSHSSMVEIICYASNEEYNIALFNLRNKEYPNEVILQGVSSMEVNCID